MKDKLIITLKATSTISDIMDFVTAINKTNDLSALVLSELDDKNQFQINIYRVSNQQSNADLIT